MLKIRRLLPLLLFLSVPLFTPAANAQVTSLQQCATEGQNCSVAEQSIVFYGADTRWRTQVVAAPIACSNEAFGGDPAPGIAKTCRELPISKTVNCSSENGSCDTKAGAVVLYGADKRWTASIQSGVVRCSNSVFGDPAPGTAKACRIYSTAPASAVNASTPISNQGLEVMVKWIQNETCVSSTPFCWKPAGYDRGPGLIPGQCRPGQERVGAACYDACPANYTRLSDVDARCGAPCDPGFERTAAGTCFRPLDTKEASRERCRSGYTDFGLTCTRGLDTYAKAVTCPDGYNYNGSSCTRPAATRSRDVTPIPTPSSMICGAGQVNEAGLCYNPPRAGYTCTATICQKQCGEGRFECGAGCASSQSACAQAIGTMVMNTGMMMANLATGGSTKAAKASVDAGKDAAKSALKVANDASVKASKVVMDANMFALKEVKILYDGISGFVNAAENDLAAISSPAIENQIAARYGRGSPNYRKIAREWASVMMAAYVSDIVMNTQMLVATTMDPTGVLDVVDAFAKPICQFSKPMPIVQ